MNNHIFENWTEVLNLVAKIYRSNDTDELIISEKIQGSLVKFEGIIKKIDFDQRYTDVNISIIPKQSLVHLKNIENRKLSTGHFMVYFTSKEVDKFKLKTLTVGQSILIHAHIEM